jgi:hypothetical protein
MKLKLMLIALAAIFGFAYWLTGLMASAHLNDKSVSASNRFIGAAFYWSFEPSRYAPKGVKLCLWGNVLIAIAAVSWIAWLFTFN